MADAPKPPPTVAEAFHKHTWTPVKNMIWGLVFAALGVLMVSWVLWENRELLIRVAGAVGGIAVLWYGARRFLFATEHDAHPPGPAPHGAGHGGGHAPHGAGHGAGTPPTLYDQEALNLHLAQQKRRMQGYGALVAGGALIVLAAVLFYKGGDTPAAPAVAPVAVDTIPATGTVAQASTAITPQSFLFAGKDGSWVNVPFYTGHHMVSGGCAPGLVYRVTGANAVDPEHPELNWRDGVPCVDGKLPAKLPPQAGWTPDTVVSVASKNGTDLSVPIEIVPNG